MTVETAEDEIFLEAQMNEKFSEAIRFVTETCLEDGNCVGETNSGNREKEVRPNEVQGKSGERSKNGVGETNGDNEQVEERVGDEDQNEAGGGGWKRRWWNVPRIGIRRNRRRTGREVTKWWIR